MSNLTSAHWGAIIGGLIGILLILGFFGKALLVALFVLLGYALGKLSESQEFRKRIRELFALLFH